MNSESEEVMELFSRKGEIGDLMRATDWSKTPLGPVEHWPQSLMAYVRMILDLPSPAMIFWGAEQTQIYNADYVAIMGPRHPRFFGAPYRESWPETYPTIYPRMRKVLDRGETIRVEKELIPVMRYGFEEEAYFTFSFSPLQDDSGRIAGIFHPVFEVTDAVLGQRRTDTLSALEPLAGSLDLSRDLMYALEKNPEDIPFALLYLPSEEGEGLKLAGLTGQLGFAEDGLEQLQALALRVMDRREALEVEDDARFGAAALLLPLRQTQEESPQGVIVFGRSPRLRRDDKYRSFLELVAGRVAAAFDRAQSIQDRERQRQILHDLFMQAPAYFAVLRGENLVYEMANPLYRQLVGGRDVLGKPIRTALPELEGQKILEILEEVYRSGVAFVGRELPVAVDREASGKTEEVVFNLIYQPLKDSRSRVEGILVLAFEVTEQVQARRRIESLLVAMREADQRKDEFLAMLAHELRNPLAAVRNGVRLLAQQGANDAAGNALMELLDRQTRALARLIDDLMDVSRITRGLIQLKKERVDLRRIVERAQESVGAAMRAKSQQMETRLPEFPVEAVGDPVRLEQVVVNILGNASKYTDQGGRIELTLERRGTLMELRVRDNGIGLEPEVMERIFTLFGQAKRGLDRSEGGLGIGLTVAQSLTELHGGEISAFSEGIGQGSEFVIRLPLAAPAAEGASGRRPSAPSESVVRRKVLVVDDNRDAALTLSLLLRSEGHQVEVAPDGLDCLQRAERFEPDCILLDIGLPGMDGYEVARRLRENPRTARVRLAALSGYSQPKDIQQAMDCGFDEYFVKPVSPSALKAFLLNGGE